MADYLEEIVQKITTRCDISGFIELSVAIEESTKKAKTLSRALSRAITPEQRLAIENAKIAQRQFSYELERERNAYSNNRLEALRLNIEKQKNANATRLQYQETARFLAQKRLETQLSRENVYQIRREISAQRRLNSERRMGGFWGGVGRRIMAFAGAYVGFHTLRNIVETGSRIQLVRASIEGLTKSTQDWQYIQQQAFKTGTEIEVVAKGYRNFYSSAKMAGFDRGNIQSMYADTLLATRAIGASTQQTEGALLALEQMLSKGTVSMEELRRQLGNAIPGAFEIGAAAMKMTTKEFNQFVKTGKLASAEFVPLFIKQLKNTYADGFANIEQTVSVAQVRLSNSWKLLTAEIMSGDTGKAFAEGLNVLRELLDSPEFKQFVNYLGQIFTWVVKIFSFLIKNLRLVLVLFGVRGFYGLLSKNALLFRVLNMEIGKSVGLLMMMGRAGKLSFGVMSKASMVFMRTLARVLAPLLLIEDILFFIGEKFWGWNTKSAIGATIAQSKQRIDKDAWNIYPVKLPEIITTNPQFMRDLEEAKKTGDYSKIERWSRASFAQPETYASFGRNGGMFTKDEKNEVNIRIENVNFGNIDGTDMNQAADAFGNSLANVITEVSASKGGTAKVIGNNSIRGNNQLGTGFNFGKGNGNLGNNFIGR